MSKGHAVVDGSNIATEGRSTPSLAQLDEAVTTFIEQYDFEFVTVIVDASFEHRVEDHERDAAKAAVDGGEIFTPPAGVIGRGDTFILEVADKAGAVVLSNDSFQEFHGIHDWLFDDGRLIGGKPIPGVGWIFVPRSPVRGPVSRRAIRQSNAMEPPPADPKIGDSRRPAAKTRKTQQAAKRQTKSSAAAKPTTSKKPTTSEKPSTSKEKDSKGKASKGKASSNSAAAWQSFRNDYPVGSTVAARVDRFSSHGAYGSVDEVNVYIPLSLLGDPAPRRARDVISLGETRDFIVAGFDEARRSIDVGLVAQASTPTTPVAAKNPQARKAAAKKTTAKKAPAKKAATKKTPAKKATTRKTTARKATAKKAPAKKAATKKTPAKKATAKKSAIKKTTAKKAPAKKAAAKKPAARKTPAARKATAKKAAASKTPAVRKATAKRAPARKSTSR